MLRYYGDEAIKMYLRVNLSVSSLERALTTISQTRTFLIKTNLKKNNKLYESLLGSSFMNWPDKFIYLFFIFRWNSSSDNGSRNKYFFNVCSNCVLC